MIHSSPRPSATRVAIGLAVAVICSTPCIVSAQGQRDVRQPDGRMGPTAEPPEITIQIRRKPDVGLHVTPRGVGACKEANADCADGVKWKVHRGHGLEPDEYLIVKYKSVGQVASRCFAELSFQLDQNQLEVSSGPVDQACQTPTVWFYVVELRKRNQTPTPADDELVCPPLDPGVLIDRGGG